jgi:hypothetical protein
MAAIDPADVLDTFMANLQKVAEEKGDTFRLKIHYLATRGGVGGGAVTPTIWAAFDGCSIQHIADRDLWLQDLIGDEGGGYYTMTVYHATDTNRPLQGFIKMEKLPVGDPDRQRPVISVLQNSDYKGPKQCIFPKLPRTDSSTRLPSSTLPSTPSRNITSGAQTEATNTAFSAAGGGNSPQETEAFKRLLAVQAETERQRRELDEQRRALDEQRHKMITEHDQRTLEARLAQQKAEFEAKLAALSATPKAPEPRLDIVGLITGIATTLAPVVSAMIADSKAREERQLAAMQAASKEQLAMMQQQAALERQHSEALLKFVTESKKDNGDMQAAHAKAMGEMANVVLQTVHTVTELQSGPQEPGWLMAIRELAPAAAAYLQAVGSRPPPIAAPPQLTGHVPPLQSQPPLGGVVNVVDELERMIRAHTDPRIVSARVFDALDRKDPSFAQALRDHGNDFEKLIIARLGGWAMSATANAEYLTAMKGFIEQEGIRRGYIKAKDQPAAPVAPQVAQVIPITNGHVVEEEEGAEEEGGEEEDGGEPGQMDD